MDNSKVNGGSPVLPGFVVYEREAGKPGYDLELALASVGPGWSELVRAFFAHMEYRNQNTTTPIVVTQVKEKYGALRIYFDGGDDCDLGFMAGLETASTLVCETCGGRGRLTNDGRWVRTECERCEANREKCEMSSYAPGMLRKKIAEVLAAHSPYVSSHRCGRDCLTDALLALIEPLVGAVEKATQTTCPESDNCALYEAVCDLRAALAQEWG